MAQNWNLTYRSCLKFFDSAENFKQLHKQFQKRNLKNKPIMYIKPLHFTLVIIFFAPFLFFSCNSTNKLVDLGNYDEVIQTSIRKLAGKKNKNEDLVMNLETAFAKANERDLERISSLKAENRSENWSRIYDLYRKIRGRQQKIKPLLPLESKDGYVASFAFIETTSREVEAKEKAADHLYVLGKELLLQAERGDKGAARTAYDRFKKIDRYFNRYKDVPDLMNKALELGVSNVLIRMVNRAPVVLPKAFEKDLLNISTKGMDTRWQKYHPYAQDRVRYDYELLVNLVDIAVSPEQVNERQYDETKEIIDGFEYILDENGNVMKDTSGNDIKVDRKVIIKATVFEIFQTKVAKVSGRIELVNLDGKAIVDMQKFDLESLFENYAATFDGDERALSDQSKKYCNNRVLPFPTNEELLLDAAVQIRPLISKRWL